MRVKKTMGIVIGVLFITTGLAFAGGRRDNKTTPGTGGTRPPIAVPIPKCGTPPVPDNPDAILVRVVTLGTYAPYNYIDENGLLTGWDIEVMREIDRREPGIKCEYYYGPWDTLFPGLDADRYDIVACQLGWMPGRDEMYEVGDNPYSTNPNKLIISPKNADKIKSWDDIFDHGYTLGGVVGDFYTMMAEQYLAEYKAANPGKEGYTVVYYENSADAVLQDIANGRITGGLNDPAIAYEHCKILGIPDQIVAVGDSLWQSGQFMVGQDTPKGRRIMDMIDARIAEFYKDGFLTELRRELLGEEFVTDVEDMAQWRNPEERRATLPADKL
jgi:L-cystine transport system substrate-binding protein